MKPVAVKRRFGARLIFEVTAHQVWRAVDNFTDLANSDIGHLVRHDAGFYVNGGAPTRTRLTQLICWAQYGGQGRDLRLPVQVPQSHLGQAT